MKLLKLIKLESSRLIKTTQNVRFYSKTSTANLEAINMSFTTYEGEEATSTYNAPPLVIMHGLFGSKRNWNSLCKSFNQKTNPQRQIIAVDARNHGESPNTTAHSYPHLAEDIKAFYKQLNIEKAALLGHSMGGRAVMYFALKYPHLVDKLIVADISPVNDISDIDSMKWIFEALQKINLPSDVSLAQARNICDKQLANYIDSKALRSFLLTNLADDSDGKIYWQINIPVLMKGFSDNLSQFPDVSGYKFDGPVLFVAGGESDYINKSEHSQILKLFPKAEFEEIDGAGHWLHSDSPNEFLQICLKFLNKNVT